ncbi:TIGR02266 family protein, partial [Corallococcus praedator]
MTGPAPKLLPLRIRLPYTAEEEFIERYGSNVGRGGVFVATRALKPEGTGLAFEFVLADGTRLLRGEGVVLKAQPDVGNARAGMTVRFTKLDAASKALIDRIVARRAGTEGEDPALASPSAPRMEPAPLPPGLVRKTPTVPPSRPSMRMPALPPAPGSGESAPVRREVAPLPGTPGVPSPGMGVSSESARRAPDAAQKAPVPAPAPVVEAPQAAEPPVLAEPDAPVSLFPEHEEGEAALASIPDVGPSRDARGNKSVPGMPQRSTREMYTVRSAAGESSGARPETKDWKAPPASSGSFPAVRLPSDAGSTGREPTRPTDPDPFESSDETTDEAGAEAFAIFTEPEFPEGRAETPVWSPIPAAPPAFKEEAPSPEPATSGSATEFDTAALAGLTPASVEAFDPNGVLGEVQAPGLSQEEPAAHADLANPSDTGATPDTRFVSDAAEAASPDAPAVVEAEAAHTGEALAGAEHSRVTTAADVEQPLDFDVDLHMDAEEGVPPEESTPGADGASGFEPTASTSEPEAAASDPHRSWEQDEAPRHPDAERLLAWGIDPASIHHKAGALPEEEDPFAAALEQAVATSDPADLAAGDEVAASHSHAPGSETQGSTVATVDDRTGASPDADAVFENTATPDSTEPHVTAPLESRAEEPTAGWAFSSPTSSEPPADEAHAAWPDETARTEDSAPVETPSGVLSEEDAWTALVGTSAQEAAHADAARAEEAPIPPALTLAEQFPPGEASPAAGVSSAAATFQSEGVLAEAASAESSTTHAASTVEEASTEGVFSDAQSLNNDEQSHASLADPAAEAFADAIPVEEGWDEEPSVFTVDSEPTSGSVANHRGETVAGQPGFEPSAAEALEPASGEAPPLPTSMPVAAVEAEPESTDPSATEPASPFAGEESDSGATAHSPETFSQGDGSAILSGQPSLPSDTARASEREVPTSIGQGEASSPAPTASDFVASPTDPTGAAPVEEALPPSTMQSASGITTADADARPTTASATVTDWVGEATFAKASSATVPDRSAEKTGTVTSEAVTPPAQDAASTAPDPLALTKEHPNTATHTAPSEDALRADSSAPSRPDAEGTAADASATGTVPPGEPPHEGATSALETTPTRVEPSTSETQHAAATSAASKESASSSNAAPRMQAGAAAPKEPVSTPDAAPRTTAVSAVSKESVSTTDAAPHEAAASAVSKESASTTDAAPHAAAASAASKDSASTTDAAPQTAAASAESKESVPTTDAALHAAAAASQDSASTTDAAPHAAVASAVSQESASTASAAAASGAPASATPSTEAAESKAASPDTALPPAQTGPSADTKPTDAAAAAPLPAPPAEAITARTTASGELHPSAPPQRPDTAQTPDPRPSE